MRTLGLCQRAKRLSLRTVCACPPQRQSIAETEKRRMQMCRFGRYHPLVTFLYYSSAAAVVMLCRDPVMIVTALCICIIERAALHRDVGCVGVAALIIAASALINAAVSHNGKTVLFFVGDMRITLEALIYGAVAGAAIASAINIFRSFSNYMTSDRLQCLLGVVSPKLALVLSVALRYVPYLWRRAGDVRRAQRGAGLYRDGSLPERIRGDARVFYSLAAGALEDGIVTADSMSARGYGVGRRTSMSRYRFEWRDAAFLLPMLVCDAVLISAGVRGCLGFEFYPTLQMPSGGVLANAARAAFACLMLLPLANDATEVIRWKYLLSKI